MHRALYSVAIVSTAAGVPAQAQEEQGPPGDLEEITVTGSRIATDPNLLISSPVTQVTAEELTYRGITRVEDLINDLPQITPALTSNEANGATGTATLDLRGLESKRTLVLVNGHRMGFGDPFVLSPDVNQIPGALVERIEVLTGGASSTYGVDVVGNYYLETGIGGFDFAFRGTWVEKFDIQQVPGAAIDECAGTFGGTCQRPRPEWKHTFNAVWDTPVEGLRAILGWRYVGEVSEYQPEGDPYVADAQQYLDLSATYTTDWFGGEETVINAGVSNITDNDPPVSGLFGNIETFGNGNTVPGIWDALGRYWFVGLTQRF